MNRRQVIKSLIFVLGATITYSTIQALINKDKNEDLSKVDLSELDENILNEFAEIILPTTKTSLGAKHAGVGALIILLINDCFVADTQSLFVSGFRSMLDKSKNNFKKEFMQLSFEEKNILMTDLKKEALADKDKPCFFTLARDLTILCYFSSEIGCTQARTYLPVPGRYDGDVDYKKGQKVWAT